MEIKSDILDRANNFNVFSESTGVLNGFSSPHSYAFLSALDIPI